MTVVECRSGGGRAIGEFGRVKEGRGLWERKVERL